MSESANQRVGEEISRRLGFELLFVFARSYAGILSLIVCLALFVPGCQQQTPGPPPTEPPLPGSLKTVIIPIPSDPPGFNAYLSDTGYEEVLGELVYEGLAEMGPDGSS